MDVGELAPLLSSHRKVFIMAVKKTTDLKSVSLGQVKDLDTKTVVGGAGSPTVSASKAERDVKKMEKTIEKVERNPSPRGGSSSGGDSKKMSKDVDKRTEDGLPPYPPGL